MTTLKIQQNTGSTEAVSYNIIERLYNLALDSENVILEGRLQVDQIYDHQYNYLTGRFEGHLYISATTRLMYFEDSILEGRVASFLQNYGVQQSNNVVTFDSASIITDYWLYSTNQNQRAQDFHNIFINDSITTIDLSVFPNLRNIARRFIRSGSLTFLNTGNLTELSRRKYKNQSGSIFGNASADKETAGDSRANEDTTPNLQKIVCPNVTRANHACLCDNGAREIYLPKVVYMLQYTVRHVPNLNLIYIGSDIQYIHYKMFDGNANEYPSTVNLVINCATPPMVFTDESDADDMTTFSFTQGSLGGNVLSKINIYVPDSAVSVYTSDTGWSSVSSRILPMSQLDTQFVEKINSNTGDTLLN